MPRKSFLQLLPALFLALLVKPPKPKPEPEGRVLHSGRVSALLSPEGYTIIQVNFPPGFTETPEMVASPYGMGSLVVDSFEANALTPETGSIAVRGYPNTQVGFTWLALFASLPKSE